MSVVYFFLRLVLVVVVVWLLVFCLLLLFPVLSLMALSYFIADYSSWLQASSSAAQRRGGGWGKLLFNQTLDSFSWLFVFLLICLRGSDTITWTRTMQKIYIRKLFNINYWWQRQCKIKLPNSPSRKQTSDFEFRPSTYTLKFLRLILPRVAG